MILQRGLTLVRQETCGAWMSLGESDGRIDIWRNEGHGLEVEIYAPGSLKRRVDLPSDQWVVLLRRFDSLLEDERILKTLNSGDQAAAFVAECFKVWSMADSRLEALLQELSYVGYRFPDINRTISLTAAAPMVLAERLIFAIYQSGESHKPDTDLVTSPSEIADILQRYGFLLEDIVLVLDSMARFEPAYNYDVGFWGFEAVHRHIPIGLRQGPDGISEAFAPILPGCLVNGKSISEVLSRIQPRVKDVLDHLIANGEPLPRQLDLNMARQRTEYQDARFFTLAVEIS